MSMHKNNGHFGHFPKDIMQILLEKCVVHFVSGNSDNFVHTCVEVTEL